MSEILRHSGALYSPAGEHPPPPPPPRWTNQDRRRSTDRRSGSLAPNQRGGGTGRKSMLALVRKRIVRLQRWARKRVKQFTLRQKILGGLVVGVASVSTILMLVFHSQILHAMLPVANKLRNWPAGWLLIFTLCYISAFPPMIGYSTSVTLAGFVYGFPNGWFIVAAATILGSTSAFIACRQFFRGFARRMVATDKRFAALSLTLKHDGITLLWMIRLCPLPYSIGNGAMSTFPTVSPWAFMAATAAATPKLIIHIFIGERLARLAEADQKMDTKTKVLNYSSIIGGILFGVITGWLIYRRTIKRAHQLEAEERARMRSSSNSSPLPSGTLPPPSYFDVEDNDPHAAAAAGLLAGLVEGDELERSGVWSDEQSGESGSEDEEGNDLLGSEGDGGVNTGYEMEGSVELERGGGGSGSGRIALP